MTTRDHPALSAQFAIAGFHCLRFVPHAKRYRAFTLQSSPDASSGSHGGLACRKRLRRLLPSRPRSATRCLPGLRRQSVAFASELVTCLYLESFLLSTLRNPPNTIRFRQRQHFRWWQARADCLTQATQTFCSRLLQSRGSRALCSRAPCIRTSRERAI